MNDNVVPISEENHRDAAGPAKEYQMNNITQRELKSQEA
jgi:hypothetical protein